MKKIVNTIFWTVVLLGICLVLLKIIVGTLYKSSSSEAKAGDLKVEVRYNRTSSNNRKVFGYAVPHDIVWRTGSGEVTEIEFSKSCTFGGKRIKKGKYSLWSIPGKKDWVIILNKETGQYGTNYDPNKDYIRVSVPSKQTSPALNDLRISLRQNQKNKGLILRIRWENTVVEVDIEE